MKNEVIHVELKALKDALLAHMDAEEKERVATREILERLDSTLHGEGQEVGVIGRIDRIEQRHKMFARISSAVATLVGLALTVIGLRK